MAIALGATLALFTLAIAFLALVDWNAMRGPVARLASQISGRPIAIHGALHVHALSWTPHVRIDGLEIGATPVFGADAPLARIRTLDLRVRLAPLFLGRIEIASLVLDGAHIRARRRSDGVANWSNGGPERPLRLPPIQSLAVRNGELDFVDAARALRIAGQFSTEEERGPSGPGGQFRLRGSGALNDRRLVLAFTGAPLVNVRSDRPYPLVVSIRMGATDVKAEAVIARPFDLTRLSADVQASGPDLADLYFLTGAALPNSPPYRLRGRLERDGARFAFTGIAGRIGDSDLSGALTAEKPAGGRLRITGELQSKSLDLDDLVAVLGGAPDPDETASTAQKAIARARSGRLLPNASLDIVRIRNMDADVAFRALRVRTERLPIRAMSGRIRLDRGVLRIDPARIDLAPGRLTGFVEIDARASNPPRVKLDARVEGVRLESFFENSASNRAPAIVGAIRGRAQLAGTGASVHAAASSADGRITVYAPSGAVREAFAELTGINVARGLGLLVTGDQGKVDLRCAAADFAVVDGTARARTFVADTETMRIGGEGGFDLRDETVDLRIRGEPKEPRLVRVAAPIRVRGRFTAPTVGLETGGLVRQGGAAAILGAVLAPLAAVLAFVDPGDAGDVDCGGLKERTQN